MEAVLAAAAVGLEVEAAVVEDLVVDLEEIMMLLEVEASEVASVVIQVEDLEVQHLRHLEGVGRKCRSLVFHKVLVLSQIRTML